jgi:hypothetical protein
MDNNISSVLVLLLRQLKVRVTKNTIYDEVIKHPDYPSISTISSVLDRWGMPNGAFNVSVQELKEVPIPFVAHLKSDNGEFALVTSITHENLIISNQKWQRRRIDFLEFSQIYGGRVLLASSDGTSGDPDYIKKRMREKLQALSMPALLFFIILSLIYKIIVSNEVSSIVAAWLITKSIGLVIAILILIKHMDIGNSWVDKVCLGQGRFDCGEILNAKASKVFFGVSWAELGALYFGSTLLYSISTAGTGSPGLLMVGLNLCTIPYTLYSIFYQWKVFKKWCLLCCAVQLIFWLEFIISMLSGNVGATLDHERPILFLLFSGLLICAWAVLKPILNRSAELPAVLAQLTRVKYDTGYFSYLLSKHPAYPLLGQNNSVFFGDSKATTTITMVASLGCSPCAHTFSIIKEWVQRSEGIRLQVVFTAGADLQGITVKVAERLMALNRESVEKVIIAMEDWYLQTERDFTKWETQHPTEIVEQDRVSVRSQNDWANAAAVEYTPTLFVNGHKIPKGFKAEELEYFY